jgi:hypothetical protein
MTFEVGHSRIALSRKLLRNEGLLGGIVLHQVSFSFYVFKYATPTLKAGNESRYHVLTQKEMVEKYE